MIKKLTIKNLAVIKETEIDFNNGYCVLTGETGAGKTLIIGAIELLLGGRADTNQIRTGEKSALVEGVFQFKAKLHMVRRKITSSGRSYAWFDDSRISMTELADKTTGFADLLGQHEHQVLLDSTSHINLLDNYCGLKKEIEIYKTKYSEFESNLTRLKKLDNEIARERELANLREFEIEELGKANLDIEEFEENRDVLKRIESSEKILENTSFIQNLIDEDENSILSVLAMAEKSAREISDIVEECTQIIEFLETAQVNINEAARLAEDIAESIDVDPEYAEQLRVRQMQIVRLTRKYNRSLPDLLDYLQELENDQSNLENLKLQKQALLKDNNQLMKELVDLANVLSERRSVGAIEMQKEIARELQPLGMEKVEFEVKFQSKLDENGPLEMDGNKYALLPTGAETAEFYISPNPGEGLKPLVSIVSGGELSRIMLVLKKISIEKNPTSTLVFDEVDSGIGGDTGKAVASVLKELSEKQQIIVVTHLPQIARRADYHYVIKKKKIDNRTEVLVRNITDEEIIEELERMHGGDVKLISRM